MQRFFDYLYLNNDSYLNHHTFLNRKLFSLKKYNDLFTKLSALTVVPILFIILLPFKAVAEQISTDKPPHVKTSIKQVGMPENFHPVSNDLFRSGQPNKVEMQGIAESGIKTVLNLRQWHSDENEAEGTELHLKRIAMDAADINDENIIRALTVIRDAEKPVLVHCWHGSDRTGAVVAMYRLVFEGADRQAVLRELRKPEFGYHRNVYGNIERYIESVDIDKIRNAVLGY